MGGKSDVLAPDEVEAPHIEDGGGNDFIDPDPPQGGGWGRGGGEPVRRDPYGIAVWVFILPVVVFFAGLTGSMLTRRAVPGGWTPIRMPALIILNSAVLLCSSVSFEIALRGMRLGNGRVLRTWLWGTTLLGTIFLAGQVVAWKELAARGVLLAGNAAGAFFYMLSAGHGAHLLGALAALAFLSARASRNELTPRRQSALKATALFWHCMDGIWLCIVALLAWA